MSAPVVGIDIGSRGGLALLSAAGELLDVQDMPVLLDGPAGRPAVNAPLLAEILRIWHPAKAYVEFVGARPGEGPTGAFAFGRSRGVVEGTLAPFSISITWLTAPTWKRAVGLTLASKDAVRAEAIRRWPSRAELFARPRDDGRAQAALIAVAGILREASK
jgi:crossover junction endodeoxyribonuclease RuvC